jgi:hypothetical protein
MKVSLVRRRTIWWPTWAGGTVLVLIIGGAATLWWFRAESFLSTTNRLPAKVLVVESWIGFEGLAAAKAEFDRGGYTELVAAGGLSNNPWDRKRWDLANEAGEEMERLGVPKSEVKVASYRDAEVQRTFATAVAAWRVLHAAGLHPVAINVFTEGPHARRSRLIFAKVFGPDTQVGVISWVAPESGDQAWWHSSARAEDLIKETAGWFYEVLLNSGRTSNSPAKADRPTP